MGYSIATPLKSAKARDEMWAFMEEHYRPWHQVEPPEAELQPKNPSPHALAFPQGPTNPDYDFTWRLHLDTDLDYDNGKNRIGYNASITGGPSGDYGYTILRWMALRAGRLRTFTKRLESKVAVPYIVYDGYEAWPVLPRNEWEQGCPEGERWCLVDENGCKRVRRDWEPPDPKNVCKRVILHEMPSVEAVLEALKNTNLPPEQLEQAESELLDLPAIFESDEPSWVFYIHDALRKLGCKLELERGPWKLAGWRKDTADAIEHAYQARERAIALELSRLSELWKER